MISRSVLYLLALALGIYVMLVGSILLRQSSILYDTFPSSGDQSLNSNNNTKTATKENISDKLENPIYCDRNSSYKSDVCFMRGDVRINSSSSTISVVLHDSYSKDILATEELIRPYPRKWETGIMATVAELKLVNMLAHDGGGPICDVRHSVPAVVFYAGGYTGNLYHEFNDGIVPLYITSQHFNKKVVFVILKYRVWWIYKYKDILSELSDHPPIDFSGDKRIHCFPEVIVGLRIHDELSIDPSKMQGNKSIHDFHRLLDRAYRPKIHQPITTTALPIRLLILSRNGSRRIENERNLIGLCQKLKFQVRSLSPGPTTSLAEMYESLVSTDVIIGVHGAAMTHLLFMRPGSVLIQIVPLGNGWAAETCYGKPTKIMSLKYMKYDILPKESSLYWKYERDDPVLRRPDEVAKKGWEVTKKLYLDEQSVTLDLERFGKLLVEAYEYSLTRKISCGAVDGTLC